MQHLLDRGGPVRARRQVGHRVIRRLFGPEEAALTGAWSPPPMVATGRAGG